MLLIVVSSGMITLSGCMESEYQRVVDEELAKGVREDSLFLGLTLGMSQKEFFAHCWQLNKQGVVTDGDGNTAVQYVLDEFEHPAFMNFYPTFHDSKVYTMPVEFQYQGWAPWNDHLSSEHLLQEVLSLLEEWYGGDFMNLDHPDGYPFYVKVDGNRRIVVNQFSDHVVKAVFSDLLVEKQLHAQKPESGQ